MASHSFEFSTPLFEIVRFGGVVVLTLTALICLWAAVQPSPADAISESPRRLSDALVRVDDASITAGARKDETG